MDGGYEDVSKRYTTREDPVARPTIIEMPERFIERGSGLVQARITWWYGPTDVWPVCFYVDWTGWEYHP